MKRYSYQASSEQDAIVSGEIEASSVSEAVIELEKRGLSLRSIQMIPLEIIEADAELAEFYRQIGHLLDRRSTWLPALEAMALEMPKVGMRRDFQKLLSPLRGDFTPQQFLASRDAIQLLPVFANGFHSENDSHRLNDWIEVVSQQLESRARRRRVLMYPAIVLLLALVLVVAFAVFLVPVFQSLLGEMEIRIPRLTQFVFGITDQLTLRTLSTALYGCAIGTLLFLVIRFWRGRALTNRLLSTLVAGSSANLMAMSASISTLAELLALKGPLPLSLSIAGRSGRHLYFERAFEQLATEVRAGKDLMKESQAAAKLPPLLIHALRPGRDGQANILLLRELSRMYSERARRRVDWFSAGIPVFMITFVGFVVGMIVLALFLPMINMITTLSK